MSPEQTSKIDYKPLFAAGFYDTTRDQLENIFLDPFSNKSRREYLLQRFNALIDRFQETTLNAEVWIDGSFSTIKPEPGDVDTIFFIEDEQVNSLQSPQLKILNELNDRNHSKIRYNCDVFIMLKHLQNDRSYWRGWFGFDRSEKPKGIVRLFI